MYYNKEKTHYRIIREKTMKEEATGELNVIDERCARDHECGAVKVCPTGALTQGGFAASSVDHEICTRCGRYADYCPRKALVLGI